MADKSINELTEASSLNDEGLLVVYQNSQTLSLPGSVLKGYAETVASAAAATAAAAAAASAAATALAGYVPLTQKGAASGVASLDANGKVAGLQPAAYITSVSAAYTLSSADYNCLLLVGGSYTITIDDGLDVGAEIEIMNYGTGATVTIAVAEGVTLNGASTSVTIPAQYTSAVLKCVAADTWVVQGAIA